MPRRAQSRSVAASQIGAMPRRRARPKGSAPAQGRLRDVFPAQAEAGEIGVAHGGQRVVAPGKLESVANSVGEVVEESQDAESLGAGAAAGRKRQGESGHRKSFQVRNLDRSQY